MVGIIGLAKELGVRFSPCNEERLFLAIAETKPLAVGAFVKCLDELYAKYEYDFLEDDLLPEILSCCEDSDTDWDMEYLSKLLEFKEKDFPTQVVMISQEQYTQLFLIKQVAA